MFRSVAANHGLRDGNKRLALATVAVFLTMNGYLFYVPRDEAVMFALRLVSPGQRPSLTEVSRWLHRHSIRGSSFAAMTPAQKVEWLGFMQGMTEAVKRGTTLYRTAEAVMRLLERQVGA